MRLHEIFEQQSRANQRLYPYSELFENTSVAYWTGIYKLKTLPLSEAAYNNELKSLQYMILETAMKLPRNMIPAFSKYMDDIILREGFWDTVGQIIDKTEGVIKQGKEMAGKAVVGAVKGVYKGAALALSAGAGLVSDLTKKVSPELHEKFVQFGKAAKDYILKKLQTVYDAIVSNLQNIQTKVASMFSKTCNIQSITSGLNLTIDEFHKFLVEAEEAAKQLTTDPVEVAKEILKNEPGLKEVDQIIKASATVWYRTNTSLKGESIVKIAQHIASQSSDENLKKIASTDELVKFIGDNKIIDGIKNFDSTQLEYQPVETISPDTLSDRECSSMTDPSLIEQLLAKIPDDAAYKKTLEDFALKSEEVIGTFKNAFKNEKRNVIMGIISAALSIATGAATLNIVIAIGGTLVPALIRVLAEYFRNKGMENAAMVTEKVAKFVSILTTVLQVFNLSNLVQRMITGEETEFIASAEASAQQPGGGTASVVDSGATTAQPTGGTNATTAQPTGGTNATTAQPTGGTNATTAQPTGGTVAAEQSVSGPPITPAVAETFNSFKASGLVVDQGLLAEKMAKMTPNAVKALQDLTVGDTAISQKTLDFVMSSQQQIETYQITAVKLILNNTTPDFVYAKDHLGILIDNGLNPDEFFKVFESQESIKNYMRSAALAFEPDVTNPGGDPTAFLNRVKALQQAGLDINKPFVIDDANPSKLVVYQGTTRLTDVEKIINSPASSVSPKPPAGPNTGWDV